jgi:tRNA G26 N,N-dimethylase Trm1
MDLGSIDNHHQTKFAGGFSFSDIVSKVKGILPGVKNVAKAVASGLESMGYGMTGAGMTGAGAKEEKKLAQVMKKMKMMAM